MSIINRIINKYLPYSSHKSHSITNWIGKKVKKLYPSYEIGLTRALAAVKASNDPTDILAGNDKLGTSKRERAKTALRYYRDRIEWARTRIQEDEKGKLFTNLSDEDPANSLLHLKEFIDTNPNTSISDVIDRVPAEKIAAMLEENIKSNILDSDILIEIISKLDLAKLNNIFNCTSPESRRLIFLKESFFAKVLYYLDPTNFYKLEGYFHKGYGNKLRIFSGLFNFAVYHAYGAVDKSDFSEFAERQDEVWESLIKQGHIDENGVLLRSFSDLRDKVSDNKINDIFRKRSLAHLDSKRFVHNLIAFISLEHRLFFIFKAGRFPYHIVNQLRDDNLALAWHSDIGREYFLEMASKDPDQIFGATKIILKDLHPRRHGDSIKGEKFIDFISEVVIKFDNQVIWRLFSDLLKDSKGWDLDYFLAFYFLKCIGAERAAEVLCEYASREWINEQWDSFSFEIQAELLRKGYGPEEYRSFFRQRDTNGLDVLVNEFGFRGDMTLEEAAAHYKKQALKAHPDFHNGRESEHDWLEKMKKLNTAWFKAKQNGLFK